MWTSQFLMNEQMNIFNATILISSAIDIDRYDSHK